MGIEIKGPSLEAIERAGLQLERLLKKVPMVEPATVNADRIVGKPYLEIHIDREAIARHGITLQEVQDVIEIAIGGMLVTTTVEGRERYPVRVRYMRELRDSIEEVVRILVPAPDGAQIPLGELAEIRYVRGPTGHQERGYVFARLRALRQEAGVRGSRCGGSVPILFGQ